MSDLPPGWTTDHIRSATVANTIAFIELSRALIEAGIVNGPDLISRLQGAVDVLREKHEEPASAAYLRTITETITREPSSE